MEAYDKWLKCRALPVGDPVRQQALARAVESPLRVAETCQELLEGSRPQASWCWPAVRADLEIGRWLLEIGVQAGLLAASDNGTREDDL